MSALDWKQRFQGERWTLIHHVVSLAGIVTDVDGHTPIVGAKVMIITGPPAFEEQRAILHSDQTWEQQIERLDCRLSRTDGLYYFLDLPPGHYTLHVDAPRLGSRYGAVGVSVDVGAVHASDGRMIIVQADIALPPTCIRGRVTSSATLQPVTGSAVRLRGDTHITLTDSHGHYILSGLVEGAPTIEASAKNFVTAIRPVSLRAGQEHVINITLEPA